MCTVPLTIVGRKTHADSKLRWTSKAHMSEMGPIKLASFVEETEAEASDPWIPSQNDQDAVTEDV